VAEHTALLFIDAEPPSYR